MSVTAKRYHDISCGHRVTGHEGKCQHLHGHNYRIHFEVQSLSDESPTDKVGRVLDFSVIKSELCMWLENNWDHHFLVWADDPYKSYLLEIDPTVVVVPFNPTAENMAIYLVNDIAPQLLFPTGCLLVSCTVEETMKCSATYSIKG